MITWHSVISVLYLMPSPGEFTLKLQLFQWEQICALFFLIKCAQCIKHFSPLLRWENDVTWEHHKCWSMIGSLAFGWGTRDTLKQTPLGPRVPLGHYHRIVPHHCVPLIMADSELTHSPCMNGVRLYYSERTLNNLLLEKAKGRAVPNSNCWMHRVLSRSQV